MCFNIIHILMHKMQLVDQLEEQKKIHHRLWFKKHDLEN
jgi:hypothetical protein